MPKGYPKSGRPPGRIPTGHSENIKYRATVAQQMLIRKFPNLFKNKKLSRVVSRHRKNLLDYIEKQVPKQMSPLTKRAKELGLNKAKYSPGALKRRHAELGSTNNNRTFNNLVKNLGLNKPKKVKE